MQRPVSRALVLVSCLFGLSCAPRNNKGAARVYVTVDSALNGEGVTAVKLKITGNGPEIDASLVQSQGAWTVLVGGIPAGTNQFEADAYDSANNLLYQGSATADVIASGTIAVLIYAESLMPPPDLHNQAPIIDSISVSTLTPVPDSAVALVAAAHDPDTGDTITYSWSDNTGSTTSNFSDPTAASTTWNAPDLDGAADATPTLTLTVTDNHGAYAADSFQLTVAPAPLAGTADVLVSLNTWPSVTAILASPGQVDLGVSTQLTSSASDPDGDPLTYSWSSADCPTGVFAPSGVAANPSFTTTQLPANAAASPGGIGTCTLTLTVDDGRGGTNTGNVILAVGPAPIPQFGPIIDGISQSSRATFGGETIIFRINAHDPNGGSPLTFTWTPDDPGDNISSGLCDVADCATLTHTAGCNGVHMVSLQITNAAQLSVTQSFTYASCATSCDQLHAGEPAQGNGEFAIDPAQVAYPAPPNDGTTAFDPAHPTPFNVQCDMANGGWTLFAKVGDSAVMTGSNISFNSDLMVTDLSTPDLYTAPSSNLSHFNLHRFDPWASTWTVRTVTSTSVDSQFAFWRPRTTGDPGGTNASCLPGSCVAGNWAASDPSGSLMFLNRSSLSPQTNSTWLLAPAFDGSSTPHLFAYLSSTHTGSDCLDSNGNTEVCHQPPGGVIGGQLGAQSADTGMDGDAPAQAGNPAEYWIINRNSEVAP